MSDNSANRKVPWYPIIWFLTMVVMIAVAFTIVKFTTKANAKQIETIAPMVTEHETEIEVLKVAQTYIKETVTDVKREQRTQRRLLESIDEKIQ